MRKIILFLLLIGASTGAVAFENHPAYLYRVSFIQAAPGKLLELIELQKAWNAKASEVMGKDGAPLWMRHSQGDRWDLMIVYPMGNYARYYSPASEKLRAQVRLQDPTSVNGIVAWREDLFAIGPPIDELHKNWDEAGFFHVEIFQALPARQAALVREREMENAYLRYLKQPTNLVFIRDQGASWDCFTVGFYRDLQHYAESAKTTPADAEAAAKAAGFDSAKSIGPYLRTLIALHHDTLGVAVK